MTVLGDMYAGATKAVKLPAHLRKTFHYVTPSDTHYRIVDCATAAEAGQCRHFVAGFLVPVNPADTTQSARYKAQGYRFWEGDGPPQEGYPHGQRVFFFPPGQRCFASRENPHRVSLDKPPVLYVAGGDWRGNPRGEGWKHVNLTDWVDDLRTNVDKLNTEIKKG